MPRKSLPNLTVEERQLLFRISAPEGLKIPNGHLDLMVARLAASGIIFAKRIDGETVKMQLTPHGVSIVARLRG